MSNAVKQQRIVSFPVKTPLATQKAITAVSPPTHPHMAPFGSNVHNDAYMSDTYNIAGPIGGELLVTQASLGGFPISLTFDSMGRIVTVVMNLVTGARSLLVIDPVSLNILARMVVTGGKPSKPDSSITGGIYFILNNENQAVIPTVTRQIQFFQITQEDTPTINPVKGYDLTRVVGEDDHIVSALPDWAGNLWYVTGNGSVGFLDTTKPDSDIDNHFYPQLTDTKTGEKEKIANSFAVDEDGGVYIVSDHALYRFEVIDGKPAISWRVTYDRGTGTEPKPGQKSKGSGTTPTLLDMGTKKFVAIADNADRMNVLVFRRERNEMSEQDRLACKQPVFAENAGATENSLIGIAKFIVVENNYGYAGPESTTGLGTTERGIARIDFDGEGGCQQMWMSPLSVPSVVSKLSLATGLVYTYVKRKIGWHFAAVYFETGKLAFEAFTGLTSLVNDHYAGLCLGPDGTAYIGVVEGIVAVRQEPVRG